MFAAVANVDSIGVLAPSAAIGGNEAKRARALNARLGLLVGLAKDESVAAANALVHDVIGCETTAHLPLHPLCRAARLRPADVVGRRCELSGFPSTPSTSSSPRRLPDAPPLHDRPLPASSAAARLGEACGWIVKDPTSAAAASATTARRRSIPSDGSDGARRTCIVMPPWIRRRKTGWGRAPRACASRRPTDRRTRRGGTAPCRETAIWPSIAGRTDDGARSARMPSPSSPRKQASIPYIRPKGIVGHERARAIGDPPGRPGCQVGHRPLSKGLAPAGSLPRRSRGEWS